MANRLEASSRVALGVSVLELELLPRTRIPLHLPCYEAGFEPHVVVQISSLTCRETGFQPSPAVGQVLSLSRETCFEPNITEQVASLDPSTSRVALGVAVLELELLPRTRVPLHLPWDRV